MSLLLRKGGKILCCFCCAVGLLSGSPIMMQCGIVLAIMDMIDIIGSIIIQKFRSRPTLGMIQRTWDFLGTTAKVIGSVMLLSLMNYLYINYLRSATPEPMFHPDGGPLMDGTEITIAAPLKESIICYTKGGSESTPSCAPEGSLCAQHGHQYNPLAKPVKTQENEGQRWRAIACADNLRPSRVVSMQIPIQSCRVEGCPVAKPRIIPDGGSVVEGLEVKFESGTLNALICYDRYDSLSIPACGKDEGSPQCIHSMPFDPNHRPQISPLDGGKHWRAVACAPATEASPVVTTSRPFVLKWSMYRMMVTLPSTIQQLLGIGCVTILVLAAFGAWRLRDRFRPCKCPICMGWISIGHKVGTGAFSEVWAASDESFALKLIPVPKLEEANDGIQEAFANTTIQHPNIVKIHEIFFHKQKASSFFPSLNLCVAMELCSAGTLLDQLQQLSGGISQLECCIILRQICNGLATIHEHGYVHGDIKPENIFIGDDGQYKIGDMGFTKFVKRLTKITHILGTPGYMAPEVECGMPYNTSADMWSLGVVILDMVFGIWAEAKQVVTEGSPDAKPGTEGKCRKKYSNDELLDMLVLHGVLNTYPMKKYHCFHPILLAMFRKNTLERPHAKDLCSTHPWPEYKADDE